MIENVQGNIRDLASAPDALLVKLTHEPVQGQLSINAESDSGGEFTETLFFDEGNLIACATPLAPGETLLQRGVKALTRPFGLSSFIVGPPSTQPALGSAPVPVIELVLEYARTVGDVEELADAFSPLGQVLRLGDRIDRLRAQVKLSPDEWKLIFRVNNKRSKDEISSSLGMDLPVFARNLFVCLAIGAIFPERTNSTTVRTDTSSSRSGKFPKENSGSVAGEKKNASGAVSAVSDSISNTSQGVRPRVLAVDDSRTVQRVVQMALQNLNLDIDLADSGEQALEIAAKNPPDIVILDIIMPGMDGYKTCEALRKLLAPRRVPVIMLTSKEGALNSLRGRMAGATAYLTKPFEDEELRKAIRENLKAEK